MGGESGLHQKIGGAPRRDYPFYTDKGLLKITVAQYERSCYYCAMEKSGKTKLRVLHSALAMVSQSGLELLTIGKLADSTGMSKSGLFAHFKSKEKLQLEVLRHAAEIFTDTVLRPSLKKPRGLQRVRAIQDNWIKWADTELPGGCVFIAASIEYDDQPGPVRDYLHDIQSKWIQSLSLVARHAVTAGAFEKSADCDQFAYEQFSLMLGYHHFKRMLTDARAKTMQNSAFENLILRYGQKAGNSR